jgi:hypothetical protein
MVWLIRVLIIGTFSIAGDKLFVSAAANVGARYPRRATARTMEAERIPSAARSSLTPAQASARSFRPAPKATEQPESMAILVQNLLTIRLLWTLLVTAADPIYAGCE